MNIYKKNVQQYKSYIQSFRCKINYIINIFTNIQYDSIEIVFFIDF